MRDPFEEKPLRKKAEKILSKKPKSPPKIRVRADEEIRQSEREFRAIFELSSVGMTERDASTGLRIRVNQRLCEMTGYSAKELLKEKGVRLTHPDDRERNREVRAAVLKGESDTWVIEKRYVRKNGEVIWVHVNGNLIRDSSGRPYRTVAVIQNITERKRAETELHEDREYLWRQFKEIESIYNSAPIGLCLFDDQMRYVRINNRLAEMNGIPTADHIGRSVRDVLPGVADKAEELGRRIFATGLAVLNVELNGETPAKPGVLRSWIEHWLPLKDQAGRVACINVVVEEVTERKRTEEALCQSQIDMDRAQEVGQIGSWRLDVRRNVLTWSDETHRIFGVPKGTPMSYEAFLEIVHPDDRQYVDTRWQAGLRGEPYDIEHRIVVGRKVKWMREKAYLEFDDEGELLGGFGIVQDITDRKQIEEELRKSRDELELRVRERTIELAKSQDRLQNLSSQLLLAQEKERKRVAIELHDGLLSELAGVKYMLEARAMLLQQGKVLDFTDLKRTSDILTVAIKEARAIMNNLHPTILDELGLIAAMNWLSGEFQQSYPHIKVQRMIEVMEHDISAPLKVVIYRVLQEALNNFAKHGKGDRVDFSLLKSAGTFSFIIRDNGKGFDLEKAIRGLGLESMRERVELSGGKFQIESGIGQGTTIRATWGSS